MSSWYKASGWSSSNDRWYTKLFKGINWALNPNHEWFDYDSWNENSTVNKIGSFLNNVGTAVNDAVQQLAEPNQLTSWVNSQTGAHLTGSQIEANQLQMQNAEDIYQRQVSGMRSAGLNPALMYQNGSSTSAPTVQGQQGMASMSDIMQAMLLKKQSSLLDSQVRKTDAETDKIGSETEYQKLVNEFFPSVTQTQIDKMLSEIGLNEEQIKKVKSEVDLNELEKDLKEIEKIIKKAESDESSAYFKAVRELAEAQTAQAKSVAAVNAVDALMKELERDFMAKTNTKMGSASVVAIASALGTLFSNFHIELPEGGLKNPFAKGVDSAKNDLRKLFDWIVEHWNT